MRTCKECRHSSYIGPYYSYCEYFGEETRRPSLPVGPAPEWCPMGPVASMAAYTITVDGRGYCGESMDETDGTQNAGLANGFHNYQSGERAALLWGDEPVKIETTINLRSHLERIVSRMRHNELEPDEIVIRRVTA